MLGIIAAISAAFSWTFACFMWRAQTKLLLPIQLNLAKNFIALTLFLPALFTFNWSLYYKEITILCLSGFIGIALGDPLYINALKRIGTRKTLTIEAFSPVLANILGILILGEILSFKT